MQYKAESKMLDSDCVLVLTVLEILWIDDNFYHSLNCFYKI